MYCERALVSSFCKRFTTFLAVIFSALLFALTTSPQNAEAVDIPFLTWERGKEQLLILGGPTTSPDWQIQLVGENSPPINFKGRNSETKGFNIYSIFIPNNLPLGAYTIQSDRSTTNLDIIAAVQVKERTFYQIVQIPPDLKLLLILFAALSSLFSVVRSIKYQQIGFEVRQTVDSKNPLYRFRRKRQVSHGESFMRYLAMRDAEILHKTSRQLWSLLPWLSLLFGIFIALITQDNNFIPLLPFALVIAASAIGAVDATSGMATALGFAMIYIAFGNVNNLRTFLLLMAFTAIWYGPSLIAALISLTLPKDFRKRENGNRPLSHRVFTSFIGSIFSICLVVALMTLTDSLSVTITSTPMMRWPLAGGIGALIFIKYLAELGMKPRSLPGADTERYPLHQITLIRTVSPGAALTLAIAFFAIIYTWSNSFSTAAYGALLLAFPFFTLFLNFPEFSRIFLPKFRRNIIVETFILAATTLAIFYGTQNLPMESKEKAILFLVIGSIPLILHSVYSVLIASAERSLEKVNGESSQENKVLTS